MSDGQLCAGLNLTLLGLDGSRTFEGAARGERSGLGAAQTMQSAFSLSTDALCAKNSRSAGSKKLLDFLFVPEQQKTANTHLPARL